MKKTKFALTLFLLYFFLGCIDSGKKKIVSFPITKDLHFKEFPIDGVVFWPVEINIMNDLVIVYDERSDWVFKVFKKDGYVFVDNIVRRGRGRNEEIGVSPYFFILDKNSFLYQGFGVVKTAKINLLENRLEFSMLEEFSLPPKMFMDHNIIKINDFLLSSINPSFTERDFGRVSTINGTYSEWGELPPVVHSKEVLNEDKFTLVKFPTVKPGGKQLAIVYEHLPVLRIYCTENGRVTSEIYMAESSLNKKMIESNTINFGPDGLISYYTRIKSTEEYIFALYSGKPYPTNNEFDIAPPIPYEPSSEIHIWRWDGTSVATLALNRSIKSFDVTPDNKQIIAISITDPDNLLVAEIPWD